MIKAVVIFCLCAILLVAAQEETPPPDGPLNRVARQAPDQGQMQGGGGGQQGDLSMGGLGNIPDPTAVISKGQEIAAQFARGRRRRDLPKIPDSIPMPPIPKMR